MSSELLFAIYGVSIRGGCSRWRPRKVFVDVTREEIQIVAYDVVLSAYCNKWQYV